MRCVAFTHPPVHPVGGSADPPPVIMDIVENHANEATRVILGSIRSSSVLYWCSLLFAGDPQWDHRDNGEEVEDRAQFCSYDHKLAF